MKIGLKTRLFLIVIVIFVLAGCSPRSTQKYSVPGCGQSGSVPIHADGREPNPILEVNGQTLFAFYGSETVSGLSATVYRHDRTSKSAGILDLNSPEMTIVTGYGTFTFTFEITDDTKGQEKAQITFTRTGCAEAPACGQTITAYVMPVELLLVNENGATNVLQTVEIPTGTAVNIAAPSGILAGQIDLANPELTVGFESGDEYRYNFVTVVGDVATVEVHNGCYK